MQSGSEGEGKGLLDGRASGCGNQGTGLAGGTRLLSDLRGYLDRKHVHATSISSLVPNQPGTMGLKSFGLLCIHHFSAAPTHRARPLAQVPQSGGQYSGADSLGNSELAAIPYACQGPSRGQFSGCQWPSVAGRSPEGSPCSEDLVYPGGGSGRGGTLPRITCSTMNALVDTALHIFNKRWQIC